jgi:ribosomal protein L37E
MTIVCISVIMTSKNKGGCIMALIKCPECGKEVSDTAKTCTNCGFAKLGFIKK